MNMRHNKSTAIITFAPLPPGPIPLAPSHAQSTRRNDAHNGILLAQDMEQSYVTVTINRARGLPLLRDKIRRNRRFFVTITDGRTTKKTKATRSMQQAVQWNETLDAFVVCPSSHLTLCLYAARRFHPEDISVGRCEIPFRSLLSSSQSNSPFILSGANAEHQATIYLTIAVSPNSAATNTSNPEADNYTNNDLNVTHSTSGSASRHAGGDFSGASGTAMPPVDGALRKADQAMESMQSATCCATTTAGGVMSASEAANSAADLYTTWEKAVRAIKQIVDVADTIAEIHPYAKMAWSVLSIIPKTILDQVARDENVLLLLQAIHDVFDLTKVADRLRNIEPKSKQSQILMAMLQHVCNCGDFIQSYARDANFWRRVLKNISGEGDTEIEDYRSTLFRLRDLFLDHATITTDISTELKAVSNQVLDASLDAKIREIPYGKGSRYSPEKRCLPGTRTKFLDYIVNWANDPESERALILFGQAGTGKSAIAHEVAHRFDDMHRLSSSFIFRRAEGSKPYLLFTTLTLDLSDRSKQHWGKSSRMIHLVVWVPKTTALQSLVDDASAFVRYFGMPIARSAPHIYISALPFAPTSSRIANCYSSRFPNTLTVQHGRSSHWPGL
ncbi:unnamed protein product [Cyclocybe aegerita]|uniref:C2 domain-containing protein n=1 Tax=Cyclocybe aegerita TaxID=1973307 RepID=A0A8S0XTF8_CYCAE|nr:unnamed protein product [Cyclocybe aegerita]